MDFTIPEELASLKAQTHKFVYEQLIPLERNLGLVRHPTEEILQKVKDMGYYGLTIPEKYGGVGLDLLGYVLVTEELAKAPKPFIVETVLTNGIGMLPILFDGTEEQRQKYLPRLARGEIVCAFALTEPGAGSDAGSITTTAERDGDDWVINGLKHFITLGGKAAYVCAFARTERGVSADNGITAFIVEKGTPGFAVSRLQDTMAGDPPIQAELTFNNCRVPQANVIGQVGHGFRTVKKTLATGRCEMAAFAVGAAERLLELSKDWANTRIQFGKPLATFQATRIKIADMATEIYAAKMMTRYAAWLYDQGHPAVLEASMAKLFATEMLGRVADAAVQIHGGMGYTSEIPVERIYRESRLLRITEGTSEIQRLIISSSVLNS
jgi:acyl-CoA dehydrogenase